MTAKQHAKLAMLRVVVAERGDGNTVDVIPSLPEGRQPKTKFPLDSSVIYALVNGRGHVAIGANGAVDLPFVRSFPGSYFAGAVIADQLEEKCDPNGFKPRQGGRSGGSGCSPSRVFVTDAGRLRESVCIAANKLSSYFQRDGQQRALEAYAKFAFAPERGWGIEDKMELYEASRRAFGPATLLGEALLAFRKIYDDLYRPAPAGGWGVGRNASGPCWPAAKTFDTIKTEFHLFRWSGPITLLNFHSSNDWAALLSSLEKMRELKPVAGYPVMAVSKFLHFYNPALFPIYDNEVIWNGVFRCFRSDFKEFCCTSGFKYEYEDTASFYCKYIRWANSLLASAHSGFMKTFVDWLRTQPGAELPRRTFDVTTLYATAFEFTAIGAWRTEIGGGR